MTDDMKRVLEKAIAHNGIEHQTGKCIEEIGELLQAIVKYQHGPQSSLEKDHLREEIADCIITLQQMRLMYGEDSVDWWIDFKLKRLNDRIDKEKRSV